MWESDHFTLLRDANLWLLSPKFSRIDRHEECIKACIAICRVLAQKKSYCISKLLIPPDLEAHR